MVNRWVGGLLCAALMACGNEGPSQLGSTSAAAPPTPPVLSTPVLPGSPDGPKEPPGSAYGGLEYDPVAKRLIIPESGPPKALPLQPNTQLPTDNILREEQVGVILEATIVHRDLPSPPNAPEVNKPGLAEANKATVPSLTITMTALGRMRVLFSSRAHPLPFSSELRARFDRFGHVAVWPGLTRYRVVAPGALRTTLGERRIDVMPLISGTKGNSGTSTKLGIPTRTVELESSLGTVVLDIATVPESGLGGPLLCRAMVELVGIDPASSECKPEEVPLHATIQWKNGGGFDLEVSSVERRTDLGPGEILVPPPNSELSEDSLPGSDDGVLFNQAELRAFRTKAVEAPRTPDAPVEGVIVDNRHDYPLTLLLDGVPVVTVPPLEKRLLLGMLPGRYNIQWRTFLGDHVLPAETVDIPAYLYSKPPPPPPPPPAPQEPAQ